LPLVASRPADLNGRVMTTPVRPARSQKAYPALRHEPWAAVHSRSGAGVAAG